MPGLSEGLILHVRQHEIVWKYIIWIYSGTEEAERWQSRQSRSAFTSLGMKADLKCETTDLLQSRQKGIPEAELPIFGNEGRVLVEKPIFRSYWQSRLSDSAEAKLQIFGSPGRDEMRKRNFTYLAIKEEWKCGSGTSHFWQSMQNESADVEPQIFDSKDRAEAEFQIFGRQGSAEAEHQVFGSQGRAEVWKRDFRSLVVKTERKCGSSTADLWPSSQVGHAEADLNIFDRPISYWLSLSMLKNNSTDCYIEGQCEDHVWLKTIPFTMRVTRSICSCKGSG